MTVKQFDKTKFGAGMKVIYKWEEYDLMSVDFEERLIAIVETHDDDLQWKRCENCELISTP